MHVVDETTGASLLSHAHQLAGAKVYTDKALYLDRKMSKEVLGKVAAWKRKLFPLLFWSSGAPLRSSEWAELSFFDTATSMRNVYIDGGGARRCVKIRTHYSKMTSRQGVKPNTRFLCRELSEILVLYLKYVYPWTLILRLSAHAQEQDPAEALELSRKIFHSTGDNVWDSSHFTRALRSVGGVGYRECRQLLVWAIRNYMGAQIDAEEDEEDDDNAMIEDAMANHSAAIREHHYARSTTLAISESEGEEQAARRLSEKVSNWCWYSRGLKLSNDFRLHSSSYVPVPQHDHRSMSVVKSLDKQLRGHMREMLHDDEAEFASPKQLEACRAVLNHPDDHILYVAPTGRGKSMTFFLPLLVANNLTIIVLCPLISLKATQTAKARESKARVGEDMNDGAGQLYFFTYEEFNHQERGRFFVETLVRNGRSVRVVWDEFHMIKSENYRNFYESLNMASWPGVKILFLSASVTPWTMKWLYSIVDRDRLLVFQEDTERLNISYCFEPSSTPLVSVLTDENLGRDVDGNVRKGIVFWKQRGFSESIKEFIDEIPDAGLRKSCTWYWRAKEGRGSAALEDNLRRFITDPDVKWLITTPALSAGVDLKVGCTIHYGPVRGITEFYQESGRCGRWPVRPLHTYETADDLARVCCKSIVVLAGAQRPIYEGITDPWQRQDAEAFEAFLVASERKECVRAAMRAAWIDTPQYNCSQLSAHACQPCVERAAASNGGQVAKWMQMAAIDISRFKRALDSLEFRCMVCKQNHDPVKCESFMSRYDVALEMIEDAMLNARCTLQDYTSRCGQCLLPQHPVQCKIDDAGVCPTATELPIKLLNLILSSDKEPPAFSDMFRYPPGRTVMPLPYLYVFVVKLFSR